MKATEVGSLQKDTPLDYQKGRMFFRGTEKDELTGKLLVKLAKTPGGRTTVKTNPAAVKRSVVAV